MQTINVRIKTKTPDVDIEGNLLIPAKQILQIGRIYVAMIEGLKDNVFGIAEAGDLLWQIEAADQKFGYNGEIPKESYVDIRITDEGELLAHSYMGIRYIVDPATGKIVRRVEPLGRPW